MDAPIVNIKIYQTVKTPDGEGILIGIETPFNGLYVEYNRSLCTVWFDTQAARTGKSVVWVSHKYSLSDIIDLNRDVERDNKIEEILR